MSQADALGFAVIWLRDVPFLAPGTCRYALIVLWKRQLAQEVHLVALNLKLLRGPSAEVLAEYLLPDFPVGVDDAAMQDAGEAQP
ncbi:hypothetical protein [Serratia liquefaciens]|uniref:hypothetical protein n=1 Tax=Serratia liquefaciens TaxID=614 RepID=UPI0022B962B5|nr:hypothetical protein [Serratia liquefaciens]